MATTTTNAKKRNKPRRLMKKVSPEDQEKLYKLRKIAEKHYKHRTTVLCIMDLMPYVVVKRKGSIVAEANIDSFGKAYVFLNAAGTYCNAALVYSDDMGWEFELADSPDELP